jgi:hypothetical protein
MVKKLLSISSIFKNCGYIKKTSLHLCFYFSGKIKNPKIFLKNPSGKKFFSLKFFLFLRKASQIN